MLTVRSAAKVPPASWPDGGCELDPISSKSLTKLPAPNWAAGRSIVVFGLTLFTGVPLTTRFLKADPAELKDELKAEACAVATARTTSAVTSPLTGDEGRENARLGRYSTHHPGAAQRKTASRIRDH